MTIAARLALLCLAAASLPACAAPCGFLSLADFGQPDQRSYTGWYSNAQYGYAAEVPPGLTAYGSPTPAPNHGFGIALSVTPYAYLFVDGSYDVLFEATADHAASTLLGYLRKDAREILSVHRAQMRLGGLRAVRAQARFRCAGYSDIFVDDTISALDRKATIVYTVSLTTSETRYRTDKATLDRVVASWRAMKPS